MGKKSRSVIRIRDELNTPDHISENFETIFWVKGSGSGIRNLFDLGSGSNILRWVMLFLYQGGSPSTWTRLFPSTLTHHLENARKNATGYKQKQKSERERRNGRRQEQTTSLN
jgi:hypothetical protein